MTLLPSLFTAAVLVSQVSPSSARDSLSTPDSAEASSDSLISVQHNSVLSYCFTSSPHFDWSATSPLSGKMRLTLALLKRKMPNGSIWIGKNRLAHRIYPLNIQRMVKRLQVEEQNMLLLRHPFLTLEQEHGSMAAVNRHEEWLWQKKLEYASTRTRPSVPMEKKLQHLMHQEKWDV